MERLKQQEIDMYYSRFHKTIVKLKDIFQHYSKNMYTPGDTFEDNSKHMQLIDMKVFVKYLKDFDFGKYPEMIGVENQNGNEILSKIKNTKMVG